MAIITQKHVDYNKLEENRREKGISRRDLADAIGIPVHSLNNRIQAGTPFPATWVPAVMSVMDWDAETAVSVLSNEDVRSKDRSQEIETQAKRLIVDILADMVEGRLHHAL